ncbi:MAG: MBL fold hydrolase, partial [Thermodesulfovibrio sp.]|nr:MBL fold hydrolase [Thermodesulfovibrio sp.]
MKIKFLGGARTVTGSCFLLNTGSHRILVDCGMHQGLGAEQSNRRPFDFDPKEIECLFLTHSHLDHVGLVPKLVNEGFRGKIITTSAAADIAELILYDSAHIQESDTEWYNRKAMRTGTELREPLYTRRDVDRVLPLMHRKHYAEIEELCAGIKYR